MTKSVCIVRLSALGDVLMLVPLVRTLQASLADLELTWVISRPAFELVEGMDGVEFIVIDKPNGISDYWRFAKLMKPRRFDVLLAAQASFRANLLYSLISAKRKIGYDKIRAKDGHGLFIHESIAPGNDHTLEGFLKFAAVLGINHPEVRWDLPINEEEREWAKSRIAFANAPVILINPAASKPERSWMVERYAEVINYAKSKWQAQIVLTGGPGSYDRSLAAAIQKLAPVDLDLVGQTRPKQLLAVIEQSDLMLCPDTGPSHMAAAVNTPVIALHAVTSARVSGPYTYQHLAVDSYQEAVKEILHKTPDETVWGTHAHGQDTMKLVEVKPVIEKLDEVLSKKFSNYTRGC